MCENWRRQREENVSSTNSSVIALMFVAVVGLIAAAYCFGFRDGWDASEAGKEAAIVARHVEGMQSTRAGN